MGSVLKVRRTVSLLHRFLKHIPTKYVLVAQNRLVDICLFSFSGALPYLRQSAFTSETACKMLQDALPASDRKDLQRSGRRRVHSIAEHK